ncbi:hypothetical protein CEXT_178201 [Caerostris extrusa]|uniref:Uncharacterized protein n=1 Tax=Caerostris extrusa TaxID=172846 RepID=A0AAV4NZT9_CAEEX|nr:hypothetical protein CEXT_178201 [Caerostris extrusa]
MLLISNRDPNKIVLIGSQIACDGITTHSKESTLSVGVRSLTNGRAGAVGGLFGRAETGTSLNPLFANELAYFRHRCRTCNRLPWSFLNIPSLWTVPLLTS